MNRIRLKHYLISLAFSWFITHREHHEGLSNVSKIAQITARPELNHWPVAKRLT